MDRASIDAHDRWVVQMDCWILGLFWLPVSSSAW